MKEKKLIKFTLALSITSTLFIGCGNDSNATVSSLPTTSNKKYSKLMYKESDSEVIKKHTLNLSFAYYMDKGLNKWYISPINSINKVDVYSLMPFKNNRNGWGTVGTNVASFNLQKETVSIDYIPDNTEYKYFDRGWGEWTTNIQIQQDIEYIRNSTVNIKWWFFQAPNKAWYIINRNGDTWRFSSKILDNGQYDYNWIHIDMGDSVPDFFVENGEKKIRFAPKGVISSYYDSSSRTIYVLSNIYNPKVYLAGRNSITGNCLDANTEVHVMEFKAVENINNNVKAGLEAGAKARGVNINLSANSSSSSSYQNPSVYYYNYNSLVVSQLHYNIIAEQSGKTYSTGWLPDNGGGCTYTPNPLQ